MARIAARLLALSGALSVALPIAMSGAFFIAPPAFAEESWDGQEYEQMPWELSPEEQSALKARANTLDAPAPACASLNTAHELKTESVRRCLAIHDSAVQAIYQAYLKDHPGTQGSVVLSLTINRAGRVTSSALYGAPTLPMDLCEQLRVQVAMIVFPTSLAGWDNNYTFSFQPETR